MKKSYTRLFNQIKDFIENDTLASEPKAMYYIDSATLSLLKTAKTISESQNIPVNQVNALDIMKNFFNLSHSISNSLDIAFDSYIKYLLDSDDLSNREKEALKKETTVNLAKYLSTLRDFLDSCGALEHSQIHHNAKMANLGLSKLKVTPEQINAEFDYTKNSHLALPILFTKAAFWTNKATKYVKHLKVSTLLFQNENLSYTKQNYDLLSNKEKILAIYKEEILTKLRNDITSQLPEDYSFNSVLVLYSSLLDYQETHDEKQITEYYENFPHIDIQKIEPILNLISEFHKEYDNIFSAENEVSAFSQDMYCIGNNFALEDDLYNYKTTTMTLLGNQLIQEKYLAAPSVTHFGNAYDKKLENYVLSIDLPNYFMPASFHYDKNLTSLSNFQSFISRMPEYKGFFMNSGAKDSLATAVLFAPSAEQKKYIKEEFYKAKSHPDSYRTKILSQMNGMANGRWQDFDTMIKKEKEH